MTPETHFDPSDGDANVVFETRARPTGFLGQFENTRQRYKVSRARVCLACGHVMFSLSPHIRREIEQRIAELEAIAPSED